MGQIRLNLDGTWEILAIEPDPVPNLMGDWRGRSSGIMFSDFIPGFSFHADLEVSFSQNGNQIKAKGRLLKGVMMRQEDILLA